jgi:hypothetical protein
MNEPTHFDSMLEIWASGLRLQPADLEEIRQTILADAAAAPTHRPTATSDSPPTATGPSTTGSHKTAPPATGGGLPTTWWQTFATQVAGMVVQANRPPALAGLTGGTRP